MTEILIAQQTRIRDFSYVDSKINLKKMNVETSKECMVYTAIFKIQNYNKMVFIGAAQMASSCGFQQC